MIIAAEMDKMADINVADYSCFYRLTCGDWWTLVWTMLGR
nr:MAG TPA: hypothetical protein [Caudoviricetes sp.]